jgi:hypothetical protein
MIYVYYNGYAGPLTTDATYDNSAPKVGDNGYVVWQQYTSPDNHDIMLFDGVDPNFILINNYNTYEDLVPQINARGDVVWVAYDGQDAEVWYARHDMGYATVANAEASLYGPVSVTASGTYNELALLIFPVGVVLVMKRFLRKK